MKVEFTKELIGSNFRDLRIAIKERNDNLLEENLTVPKRELLDKILENPDQFLFFEDYALLYEMAAQTKKLWKPEESIKVYFFGGQDSRTQTVLKFASIWCQHCSIKFDATNRIEEAKIRVGFQAPSSWSFIGTDALGVPKHKPTINFGWLDDDLPERDYKQVVLHEFGHALGLIHEHQNPDIKIKWNKPYVYWYFWLNHNWTKGDVETNIFQEFEKTSTQHSEVDRKSIMAYHIPRQFTLDGMEFPQNYELSEIDKRYIGKIYPMRLNS